jgi:outer membrane protein assembly factor BamB
MRRGLLPLLGLALLVTTSAAFAAGPRLSGWLSFGNSVSRTGFVAEQSVVDPSALHLLWTAQVDGAVTAQPLVLRDVPNAGDRTVYIVTNRGSVWAINQNGYAIAKRTLGTMTLPNCSYLPGNRFGITGTPTLDPATDTLYVADALGYVHALDPVTLNDKPGWPVRLYRNTAQQLIWGALTLAGGKLYVGTGVMCQATATHLYAIDLRARTVEAWSPVPMSLGGGGGMWAWGGAAYDAPTKSILVAPGDALPGGKNVGKKFTESAGYAEHVVQLTRALKVRQANAPQNYKTYTDRDLTGAPIVMRASGCPALVAVQSKSGNVYVWKLGSITKGVWWKKKLAPQLNGQPAWSPLTRSLYVVGHTRAYRLRVGADCTLSQVWSVPLSTGGVNGPPLVTGNTIWFAVSADQTLWAVDANTGKLIWKGGLAEPAYAPPAILDGRVYEAAFLGLVAAFG